MQPGEQTEESACGFYPPTLWTQILAAREGGGASQQAWTVLVERYRGAIRSQVAARIQEDPDNVTDAFLAYQFTDLVVQADRSKARFRSLLATALRRFIHSELRNRYALKRGAGQKPLPLDTAILDSLPDEDSVQDTIARGLDYQIAREASARAFARVRADRAHPLTDEAFELLLGKEVHRPIKEIATRLGVSGSAAKTQRHRLALRWRQAFRAEVGDLVAPADVDDEMRYLASLLKSGPPDRAANP
jgi:hypothetical protein